VARDFHVAGRVCLPGGTFHYDGSRRYAPSNTAGDIDLEVDDVQQRMEDLRKKRVAKLESLCTPACRMSVVWDTEGAAMTLHQVTQ
jgi:hypothetical protein